VVCAPRCRSKLLTSLLAFDARRWPAGGCDPHSLPRPGVDRDSPLSLAARAGLAALNELDRFSNGASFWSWGKDELNMMAISCYVADVRPIIPAYRFDNACKLLLKAGMPNDDMKTVRSNMLADYYGIEHPPLRGHDALDDALSVAYVLQHLLRGGQLSPESFQIPQLSDRADARDPSRP
jgi:hypothetical protein